MMQFDIIYEGLCIAIHYRKSEILYMLSPPPPAQKLVFRDPGVEAMHALQTYAVMQSSQT